MTTLRTSLALGLLTVALLLGAFALDRQRGDDAEELPALDLGDGATQVTPIDRSADPSTATSSAPRVPATGLDPGLVAAFEAARAAAGEAGHTLVINSGFRTAERQQELLDEEVAKRGSLEAATRWVFPPERSMHVQGLAIDVGDGPAADWLEANGARYGLCHTLAWEWWHFEWRPRWEQAGACPAAAQDPSGAPGI